MKTFIVAESDFDLDGLLNATLDFLATCMGPGFDPSIGIYPVEKSGGAPTFHETGRMVKKDLDKGLMLFFPFTLFNESGEVPCIDGNSYFVNNGKGAAKGHEGFLLLQTDMMGYLVGREERNLRIGSAVCYARVGLSEGSSVDLVPDCGPLDIPAEKFIRGFVRD